MMNFPMIPSSSIATKNQWSIIWTLTLPEKIKIFIWRATNNLLLSAENLLKRKVIQEPTCQVCKMGVENAFHALVACKAAKKIWKIIDFADDLKEVVE